MAAEQRPMDKPMPRFVAGPEHQSLARFEGTWRADVRIWFDPAGEPVVSRGTMKNSVVLGGRFLQQEYRDDAGQFEGRGFWGYNDVDRRFEGFWIDGMATFFQLEQGQHDAAADTYRMTGTITNPQTGQPMKKRSEIRYLGPDEHTMEMFFDTDQGSFRSLSIRYTRA